MCTPGVDLFTVGEVCYVISVMINALEVSGAFAPVLVTRFATACFLQVWPVDAPSMTTVPCGGNLTITLEGRNALVLSIAPLTAAAAPLLLLGRASRRLGVADAPPTLFQMVGSVASTLRIPASSARDSAVPRGVTACATSAAAPLFVLVPESSAASLTRVEDAASGTELAWNWVGASASDRKSDKSGCWRRPRSFFPAPVPFPGTRLLRIEPPTRTDAAAGTFVHNAPIAGMSYDPSFIGGVLTGTVNVPTAVFAQVRPASCASLIVRLTRPSLRYVCSSQREPRRTQFRGRLQTSLSPG